MVHSIFNDVSGGNTDAKLCVKDKIRLLKIKINTKLRKNVSGKKNIDRELYGSGIILKNLAIVEKERPLSAQSIFEILMENSDELKPVYQDMISLYQSGYDEEAFAMFGERTGTKAGKHFAMILSKLDRINPWDLIEQIDVFLGMVSEERMTEAMKEIQRTSLISTAWVTAVIFALLINFTVVVIFLDMLNTLQNMFI